MGKPYVSILVETGIFRSADPSKNIEGYKF